MRYQNENVCDVVDELFSTTTSQELSDELTMLMDNYIRYAPVNRESLANTASLSLKMINFFQEVKAVSDKIKEIAALKTLQNTSVAG